MASNVRTFQKGSASEPAWPAPTGDSLPKGRGVSTAFVVAALLIVSAMLIGRFVTESPRKLLWLDELYTFYQVEGMSLGRFFESLSSGANLMPPFYFLVLWGLGQLVELTPAVLRAISLLAIVGCVPVLYSTLKRVASSSHAALVIGAVFLTDQMVWVQLVEARPYALGILLVALLAETLMAPAGTGRSRLTRWCWLAALNFLLPATHYFLGLYSAIALVVVVGADVVQRRFCWRTCLAFVVGWALFVIVCGPVLWRQLSNVGAGTGWIRVSTRADVVHYVTQMSAGPIWAAVTLALAVVLTMWCARRSVDRAMSAPAGGTTVQNFRHRWVCLGLGLGWCAFPVASLVLSGLTRRGLFVDRYFAPTAVGMVLLLGWMGGVLWCRFGERGGALGGFTATGRLAERLLAAAMLIAVMALAGVRLRGASAGWQPGREKLAQEIERRTEIKVSEDEHAYFHVLYYGKTGSGALLICNDEAARVRWRIFSENVRTVSDEELGALPDFLWLSPEVRRDAASVRAWAARHGYDFERLSAMEADGVQKIGWRTYYTFMRRAPDRS